MGRLMFFIIHLSAMFFLTACGGGDSDSNSVIETGRKFGMQSIDDAIMQLLQQKIISPEDAYNKAVNKAKFRQFLTHPPEDFTEV